MMTQIPLKIIERQNELVLWFDKRSLQGRCVERATLFTDIPNEYMLNFVFVEKGEYLTEEERAALERYTECECAGKNTPFSSDITQVVREISRSEEENCGIVLSPVRRSGRFKLCCQLSEFTDDSGDCDFDERILFVTSEEDETNSVWVNTACADMITFFIENRGEDTVTCRINNSPNKHIWVNDTQVVMINVGETADLVPSKFSKFMRLHATSLQDGINLKVWVQMQRK